MTMKILQVLQFFSPVHGGSAEAPYNLSRELVKRGHEVTIYTSDYKISHDYVSSLPGARVVPFKTWLTLAKFNFTPGMSKFAREDLKRYDVIHMHNYRTFQNIVAHHYALKYCVPYVLQAHGSLGTYFSRGGLKRAFDSAWGYRMLKDASCSLALSEPERDQYTGTHIPLKRVEIVSNGLHLDDFTRLPPTGIFRRKQGLASEDRVILYLGRVERNKGLDLLLKAFARLAGELPPAKLFIVGPDEGYAGKLKALAGELGVAAKVTFTGPLYGEHKLAAYVDADVFVLPSYYEIFGMAALEACACDIPVVVSDQCGVASIISRYKKGCVARCNVEAMTAAISGALASNSRNAESSNPPDILRAYDWSEVARRIEAIYESVVAGAHEVS